MFITPYSFINAVLWFSLFILIADILRRKTGFLLHYNINVLLFLVALTVFRLCVPIETSMTIVIPSEFILVFFRAIFVKQIILFGTEIYIYNIIIAVYISLTLILVCRLIYRILRDRKFIKNLSLKNLSNEKIEEYVSRLINETNKGENFRIIVSDEISKAMLTGIISPTILLPDFVLELNNESIYHVLKHEWHHAMNKDLWVKLLIEILCLVCWWNPLVYLLKSNLEQTLEIKCDKSVISKMDEVETESYLNTLLNIIKKIDVSNGTGLKSPLVLNCNFSTITANSSIKQRFQVIVYEKNPNKKNEIIFLLLIFSVFLFSYATILQPVHEVPVEEYPVGYRATNENSYIVQLPDGSMEFYFNDELIKTYEEGTMNENMLEYFDIIIKEE